LEKKEAIGERELATTGTAAECVEFGIWLGWILNYQPNIPPFIP
jgi:hypothetical protein